MALLALVEQCLEVQWLRGHDVVDVVPHLHFKLAISKKLSKLAGKPLRRSIPRMQFSSCHRVVVFGKSIRVHDM